jgi:hypothetical protein
VFVIQALPKREPGSHKGSRSNVLRSRIRLRLSGMTVAAIRRRCRQTPDSRQRASELALDHLGFILRQAQDEASTGLWFETAFGLLTMRVARFRRLSSHGELVET